MVIWSIVAAFAFTGETRAQQNVPVPQISPGPGVKNNVPDTSPEPQKPKRVYQSACPALLKNQIAAKPLPPVFEDECGERSPLALGAILTPQKTTLSSTPQVNCRMATALVQWTGNLNAAANAAFDARVETILTGNGYQCRRRNNQPDGKISEHGFANAIDILGFKLANGEDIVVERDWGGEENEPELKGIFLRTIHKQACEIFTTVLGPDTNEYHKDHFHFDLGCHGKGCGYLICE